MPACCVLYGFDVRVDAKEEVRKWYDYLGRVGLKEVKEVLGKYLD
jgi:hypothetical protein